MEGIAALICIVIIVWAYSARIRQYDRKLLRQEIGASPRKGTGFVYFWRNQYDPERIKIGRARDWQQRMRQFQTAQPYPIEVVGVVKVKNPVAAEKIVHTRFEDYRIRQKGGSEWFQTTPSIMTYARAVCDPLKVERHLRL